ncbi:hypothetical protein C8246_11360 [Paracidovorax avenae]|uniref:hypothetical protein n=1 Tax=Paracidovorax avenae TaxID=80867 RepID=UPI000D16D3A0|nr:hypothetical protein [Paracidovorax avenae]AVS92279.1 hypothetical protein C8246_11360 [Paracidovorax avenae]AVS97920.1 hypothetical protein C8236_03130 [Paracidovorax avenae]AVT04925.1 hypothetical protein C8248_02215 [Paracidovorax avenae]AVT19137.1 hypothetical protein C7Y68_03290 [Paracidovorax avenae]
MNALQRYQELFALALEGDGLPLSEFIDKVRLGEVSLSGVDAIVEHIKQSYDGLPCRLRATTLTCLFQMHADAGYEVARRDLPKVVAEFRRHADYLHQVVGLLVKHRRLRVPLAQDDFDTTMRVAFALNEGVDVNRFLKK